MSNRSNGPDLLSRSVSRCKQTGRGLRRVFCRTRPEELTLHMEGPPEDRDGDEPENKWGDKRREEVPNGGSFVRGGDSSSNNDSIEAGKRSENWFNRLETITKGNRERAVRNEKQLSILDQRTVWIARLLIGILGAMIAGLALNYFP